METEFIHVLVIFWLILFWFSSSAVDSRSVDEVVVRIWSRDDSEVVDEV